MNDAGKIGFVMKGDYDSTAAYDYLDVVYSGGSSYVAKKLTIGNAPEDDSEYWLALAKVPDDIVTGIKGSQETGFRNGNVTITPENIGALPKDSTAASAERLDNASLIDGIEFDGSKAITHYATCTTAASEDTKTVSMPGFSLAKGSRITVYFSRKNTAANPSLSVNGSDAKLIHYNGSALTTENAGALEGCCEFVFNGTYWNLTGNYTLVKGNSESSYRRNLVNLTAENIGALPIDGGNVTGKTSFTAGITSTGYGKYIAYPEDGELTTFTTVTGSRNGYCKIITPLPFANEMVSFTVTMYDFSINESVKYFISFNASSSSSSQSVDGYSAVCIGKAGIAESNLSVRFGIENGKPAVTIGEADTNWSYPQIKVHDIICRNPEACKRYNKGWTIDITSTPLSTVNAVVSNTHVAFGATAAKLSEGGESGYTLVGTGTANAPVWKAPNYAVCLTERMETEKTADIPNFKLAAGVSVIIKFSDGFYNGFGTPTLNISNTGAKEVRYNGSPWNNFHMYGASDEVFTMVYDGLYWNILGQLGGAGYIWNTGNRPVSLNMCVDSSSDPDHQHNRYWCIQMHSDNTYGKSFAPYQNGEDSLEASFLSPLNLGNSAERWDSLYCKNSAIQTSDRNEKKEIKDISESYEKLFMMLQPKSFIYKDGTRIHIGAISQDVEDAMNAIGLTGNDFGGFCKDHKFKVCHDENGEPVYKENGEIQTEYFYTSDNRPVYKYSLRYEEFIFLTIHMLQKNIRKTEELEKRVARIEAVINKNTDM